MALLIASLLIISACSAPTAEPADASPAADVVSPTYERDVLPLLTRSGCNAGACHGKARGQNGFQLSLLGFDTDSDHAAIASEGRGRRVFPAAPEQSLLLRKATAEVPHGGGRRVEKDGETYQILKEWIANGLPRTPATAPKLVRVAISPTEMILQPGALEVLKVTATDSDGSTRDVTHLAAFQSNESAVVAVDPSGLIKAGTLPGEAAITARFQGFFATCEVSIPLPGTVDPAFYVGLPQSNFIDGHVWNKLKKLGLTPSAPCSDSTFIRRAALDIIGRLPNPEEAQSFLNDPDLNKRERLVERLLARPEYADYWANKWVDLLRPNPYRVGIKAVISLDQFVRDAFRRNAPYDEFVRSIVAARGSTFRDGASVVFRDRREPEEIAPMISQLFLGIRLECAKCHHHPFESWGQEQFYEFAAYFAKVARKGKGISPPISGSEEMVYAGKKGTVKHPLTGKALEAKPLFGEAPPAETDENADLRDELAVWMTDASNPYFARVIVNRVWADLMGRGIVEPVDDLRATNPPTNEKLLEALAEDFRVHRYDLKHLIKTITTSYVYGLSSDPNDRNGPDTQNYSRHYRQRLRAEVLLDAIVDITEIPESFDGAPAGTRATAIWTHRTPSLFLDTFGRPDPNQDPPCERTSDTSVVQALHLMNAPTLHAKLVSDGGLVDRLAKSNKTAGEVANELYLLCYARRPFEDEITVAEEVFRTAKSRRIAVEDLLWALFNSAEFVFKD